MISHATLVSYFETQYRVQRPLRKNSAYFHRRSLQKFVEWLGQDPPIGQIDDNLVSNFVVAMEKDGWAPRSILRWRVNVLSTIRHAARAGLAQMPLQPRSVRVPTPMPEAWTVGQVRQLLATCDQCLHGAYLRACILTIWDTGLRYGDVRSLSRDEIEAGWRRQNKTTDPIRLKLRQETLDALDKLPGSQPLKYRKVRQTYKWWAQLCRRAGVPHGGPQRLRRSAATELERVQPGAATAFLGHRSADLARRHYLDPRILRHDPPRPDAL
jgi:integrase